MATAANQTRSAESTRPPHKGTTEPADAARDPNIPHEPRALREWIWREDPDTSRHPLDRSDGRGGSAYLTIRTNDLIWTGERPGTPPKDRSDGTPWRYGLNLRTARTGWFPCTYAIRPAARFRHLGPRFRVREFWVASNLCASHGASKFSAGKVLIDLPSTSYRTTR